MDIGIPALSRDSLIRVGDQYTKPIWERSAFRTWVSTLGSLAVASLSGQMAWRDAGIAAAIASVPIRKGDFVTDDPPYGDPRSCPRPP